MGRSAQWLMIAVLFLVSACSSGGGLGTSADAPSEPVLSAFSGSVDEDAIDATYIGQITVNDGGSAVTGIVLSGSGEGNFTVDENGLLKVAVGASLDFERLQDYALQAVATNSIGSSTLVLVAIHVNNTFDIILKTAQTITYVDFDDGHYQKGFDRNYTRDDDNNTVTDNVSKLMWQDDSSAASVTRVWLTPDHFVYGHYYDTAGNTAATYCNSLVLSGYSDWRLPEARELKSIVDYSVSSPAINPLFLHVALDEYWSGTTHDIHPENALKVDFGNGEGIMYLKDDAHYVRCVRNAE